MLPQLPRQSQVGGMGGLGGALLSVDVYETDTIAKPQVRTGLFRQRGGVDTKGYGNATGQ